MMKSFRLGIFFLIAFSGWWLALMQSALARSDQYRFDFWTTDDGLPQNSVYSILQTRDGYLWFTTLDGLVRYDGAQFTVFNKANSGGINSNRFTRLVEDRDGQLWACTEDGGLSRYKDGAFTTYTTEQGLHDNWVFNLRRTDGGDLLVQTNTGLARWQNGRFESISTDVHSFDSVLGYQGPSGAIWYRLGASLRRVQNGEATIFTFPEYRPDDQSYPQLYEDRQGRLWIGTLNAELLMLKNGVLTRYTPKDGLPSSMVTAFREDREGTLWFGTDEGLVRFKDGRFITFTKRDGLPTNRIVAIYEDREGTLWLGTIDGGLVRIRRQIIKAYSEDEGLPRKSYYPLMEDRSGNIWIGGEGLYRLKNGSFTYYALNISPDARRENARYRRVTALYEDIDGRLWIGSDRDLFSFKHEKFTVESERFGADVTQTTINAIHRDNGGWLWFGGLNGLIRCRDGECLRYTAKDGLPQEDVYAIHETPEGDLWIGTYGGVAVFSHGRFISYTENDGLSSNRVRAIYQDSEGTLWIGTYDGGLNRFKKGSFTRYTMSEGLFSNGVFQILEDDAGNFWMSSNQGIFRVSRRQLDDFAEGKISAVECISYGRRDGMLTNECNGGQQPAGFKSRDGRLWFPTIAGIVVVDPGAVSFNSQPPPVVIERVLLDQKPLNFRDAVSIYPGQLNLEIDYAGLSFKKPDYVRFRYRLEGLDANWSETTSRRAAFFPHLPAGEYVFKVIAANSDGVWNEKGASIRIVVIPPFWQTGWFRALLLTSVVAMAAMLFRARIQKLQKEKAAQAAFSRQLISSQERERKRIAAELHDGLGQNLLLIKNWAMIVQGKVASDSEARPHIDEIAEAASQSIREVREIAHNLRPYHLDEIGITGAIKSMVKKVSDASTIHFSMNIDPLDRAFENEVEINLYRIVQECINNVIKHSRATEAAISITREPRAVLIVISDNGKGFDTEKPSGGRQGGLGLKDISERAQMLGGTHVVQSIPGKGTAVTIRIDLREQRDEG